MFTSTPTSIRWTGDGEVVQIDAWGEHSVRVRASAAGDVEDTRFALLDPTPSTPAVVVDGDVATLENGRIRVVVTQREGLDWQLGYTVSTCDIAFLDVDGRLLLKELDAGGALKLRARDLRPVLGTDSFRATASFESDPDERLVGMGVYQQDALDLKGRVLELAHRNSQSSVPFVLSSAGYGFLWHVPAIGRVVFGRNRTEWTAETTGQIDYWITAAGSPRAIASAYADATGHAPMMPEYGLGFWQCKLRYWNQEQLLEVAREHRRRGLPLDVIVADFFHWPKMGDYRFDEEFWPDPDAMIAELHELGVELMVSVWPQVSVDSENFAAFRRANHLVSADRGTDVQMTFGGPSMYLDVTHPGAREAVWALCKRNYHDRGVRLFWLDEAEPEYGVYDFDAYRYHLGANARVGNVYPQLFSRAFHDGMSAAGQEDVVNLVRTAWAGSQRYGALVWSGDIHSTFADLRRQIAAAIHVGVAGIPWFTTDIGGFHGGDGSDPDFVELLIRWFQFGAFSPVMRLHGDRQPSSPVTAADGSWRVATGADNEVWSFGDEATGILEGLLHLRERLRPVTRGLMAEAHDAGQPVVRGLFHEFPEDPAAWTAVDQYLFGPDLLVAPVTALGAREREVHLPAGATWVDLRSGEQHEGGRTVTVPAPLDSIPVFARDGALPELIGAL
ncbi:glycoside hydrolase family 31 protein [Amnibacterium kyonggiense]|uniref:Alpha-D-xyloside xylohydrolase n=1 Tax=Amnibacterium kyonggiense TaxID=595671 RepID=A0A4V3EAE8_9MICO|nr:TIM-barrel domain-containing protein [Amnibacterium kyonggiense]TDS75828.1 alpha-D-xyloside xylohydrolase [Amnibacterium kyonggiense]